MSRIIRTRYDNNRCKACGEHIPYGVDVRHTGGYGVTHLECPHAPDQVAQQPQQQQMQYPTNVQSLITTIGELTVARDAALADGLKAHVRSCTQEVMIAELRMALQRMTDERNAAREACAVLEQHISSAVWPGPAAPEPEIVPSDLIVMAPLDLAGPLALPAVDDCDL